MSGSGDPYPVEEYAVIKTTKAHFEKFKKWFDYYTTRAGLKEWRFDIVHGDCGDAYSTVNTNADGRVVTVCFNSVWCDRSGLPLTTKAIRNTAKHEVNEMLVTDLVNLVVTPFKTRDELERTRHTLVRRLDNIIE